MISQKLISDIFFPFCLYNYNNMLYIVLPYAIFLAFTGMLNLKSFRALFMIPFVFAIQSIAYAIGFIRGWFYLSVLHCDPHKKFPQMFRK